MRLSPVVVAIVASSAMTFQRLATDAERFWDQMLEAKGGRQNLAAVHGFVVTVNIESQEFTARDLASGERNTPLSSCRIGIGRSSITVQVRLGTPRSSGTAAAAVLGRHGTARQLRSTARLLRKEIRYSGPPTKARIHGTSLRHNGSNQSRSAFSRRRPKRSRRCVGRYQLTFGVEARQSCPRALMFDVRSRARLTPRRRTSTPSTSNSITTGSRRYLIAGTGEIRPRLVPCHLHHQSGRGSEALRDSADKRDVGRRVAAVAQVIEQPEGRVQLRLRAGARRRDRAHGLRADLGR